MSELSNFQPGKRAYRIKEAVRATGISRAKFYTLMQEGKLRTVKVGGSRLIPADALEALIAEGC